MRLGDRLQVMLRAIFVKRSGQRDRVYVTRSDSTTTGWEFPSYGHGVPHDLCHLVVESELGLRRGFWGLVDEGMEVGLVDNQATLMQSGHRLTHCRGADLSGLLEAEEAVARLARPGAADPDTVEPESEGQAAATARRRLDVLAQRWADLADGESISVEFCLHRPIVL